MKVPKQRGYSLVVAGLVVAVAVSAGLALTTLLANSHVRETGPSVPPQDLHSPMFPAVLDEAIQGLNAPPPQPSGELPRSRHIVAPATQASDYNSQRDQRIYAEQNELTSALFRPGRPASSPLYARALATAILEMQGTNRTLSLGASPNRALPPVMVASPPGPPPGGEEPPPTYDKTSTCQGGITCIAITCSGAGTTCNGVSTCNHAYTCGGYPTCDGSYSCSGSATCNGSATCVHLTCNGGATCNGVSTCSGSHTCGGYPTCDSSMTCEGSQTCNGASTCTGGPTCIRITCGGRTQTCNGTSPTCTGQYSCGGWPTCNGSGTCGGYETCNGTPTCISQTCRGGATCNGVSTCNRGSTCGGWSTCDGSSTCYGNGAQTCNGADTCAGGTTCVEITCRSGGATCVSGSTCKGDSTPTCSGQPTCRGTQTCVGGTTCNGGATCISQTCRNGDTCNGGHTCDGSNTCGGTWTCDGTSTCAGGATCGGGSTCNGAPTCVAVTCYSSGSTCDGGSTCTGANTCGGYPTCDGTATCGGTATCDGTATCFTQTCSDGQTCDGSSATCNGGDTCGGYPTCDGTQTCGGTTTCTGESTCDGGETCAGTETCESCEGAGSIAGTVYDAMTGQPLPGAYVSAVGPSSGASVTNAWGAYSVDGLDPGSYSVTASKVDGQGQEQYEPKTVGTSVTANQCSIVDFSLVPLLGTIYGVVTDSETDDPIEGADVFAWSYWDWGGDLSQSTDENGYFEFSDVEPGDYYMDYIAEGYEDGYRSDIYLPPGGVAEANAELDPKPGGTIFGNAEEWWGVCAGAKQTDVHQTSLNIEAILANGEPAVDLAITISVSGPPPPAVAPTLSDDVIYTNESGFAFTTLTSGDTVGYAVVTMTAEGFESTPFQVPMSNPTVMVEALPQEWPADGAYEVSLLSTWEHRGSPVDQHQIFWCISKIYEEGNLVYDVDQGGDPPPAGLYGYIVNPSVVTTADGQGNTIYHAGSRQCTIHFRATDLTIWLGDGSRWGGECSGQAKAPYGGAPPEILEITMHERNLAGGDPAWPRVDESVSYAAVLRIRDTQGVYHRVSGVVLHNADGWYPELPVPDTEAWNTQQWGPSPQIQWFRREHVGRRDGSVPRPKNYDGTVSRFAARSYRYGTRSSISGWGFNKRYTASPGIARWKAVASYEGGSQRVEAFDGWREAPKNGYRSPYTTPPDGNLAGNLKTRVRTLLWNGSQEDYPIGDRNTYSLPDSSGREQLCWGMGWLGVAYEAGGQHARLQHGGARPFFTGSRPLGGPDSTPQDPERDYDYSVADEGWGSDCSGFVCRAAYKAGIVGAGYVNTCTGLLTAGQATTIARHNSPDSEWQQMEPGDFLLWTSYNSKTQTESAGHVGYIYWVNPNDFRDFWLLESTGEVVRLSHWNLADISAHRWMLRRWN